MENVKMLFFDSSDYKNVLQVRNSGCDILITIENSTEYTSVYLNKATAVRLVRELKKQIGNLKTDE